MCWIGGILFHEIEEQDDIFGFQENQLLFYVAFKKLSIHKLYMLLVWIKHNLKDGREVLGHCQDL